jgi:predicted nucleic acid-binding protein
MAKPSGKRLPRVMLDATVLIAGSAFPRWPREVLNHALIGDYILVLSPLLINQAKYRLESKFPDYLKDFEQFLKNCNFELVEDPSEQEVRDHQDIIRDKKDIPIALAAIKAGVDYFITDDRDFTVKDKTTQKLRKHFKPMLPGTFLKEVMGWTSKNLEEARHRKWSDIES